MKNKEMKEINIVGCHFEDKIIDGRIAVAVIDTQTIALENLANRVERLLKIRGSRRVNP